MAKAIVKATFKILLGLVELCEVIAGEKKKN